MNRARAAQLLSETKRTLTQCQMATGMMNRRSQMTKCSDLVGSVRLALECWIGLPCKRIVLSKHWKNGWVKSSWSVCLRILRCRFANGHQW